VSDRERLISNAFHRQQIRYHFGWPNGFDDLRTCYRCDEMVTYPNDETQSVISVSQQNHENGHGWNENGQMMTDVGSLTWTDHDDHGF